MNELVKIRRYLHAHPELSGEEEKTSKYIADYLYSLGHGKIYKNSPHHSVLAEIEGRKKGPTILFRCELDALPVEEANNLEYKSQIPGISHKCGHDGHMATMLGFARKLVTSCPAGGKVLLLFQSAEETGEGAKNVLESGMLDKHDIDFAFSFHNIPGYNLGDIICKSGNFTLAVESVRIELTGKPSHAAEPGKGINPSNATAGIVLYLNGLNEPDKKHKQFFISTPITIQMGKDAYGISAGEATIGYTFRTRNNTQLLRFKKEIEEQVCQIVSKENGLRVRFEWSESFRANINHPLAFDIVKKAALSNNLPFIEREEPFDWGEDFGLFTEQYKGAMFGIGAGRDCPAVHTPEYDFPDKLIDVGMNMLESITREIIR